MPRISYTKGNTLKGEKLRFHNHSGGRAAISCLALMAALPAQALAQSGDSGATALDAVMVTGTRTETPASEIARSTTVIDREQIEEQTRVNQNLGDVLAKTVPGMAPSTESISNYSQTLRGRNFLVLIDGIPQSTTLEESGRELNTIGASAIERIEIVRGGTAVYGFGATGGVVNVITKQGVAEGTEGYSEIGGRFSTEHVNESGDIETEHRISGTQGAMDYLLAGSYITRGSRFDADGDRIPPDPLGAQGGYADSEEYDLLAKAGFDFDNDRQRVEFMLNRFENEQDSDYTIKTRETSGGAATEPVLEDGSTVAIPRSEAPDYAVPAENPGTENTVARATYAHRDVLGSSAQIDVYYGDQAVIFPKFVYPGYPQTGNTVERHGARTTVDTPLDRMVEGAAVTWGVDYLNEDVTPKNFGTNADPTAPEVEQSALAGFAELEVPVSDIGLIRGGVRHESIDADVGAVSANSEGNSIEAGTAEFSETMFNLGGVLFVSDSVDVFANYSEGFSLGNLVRLIQDADSQTNYQAKDFEGDAEKTTNYELGTRYYGGAVQGSLAVFYSETKSGRTFDGNLRLGTQDEEIWGVEGTTEYTLSDRVRLGGSLTWLGGKAIENGEEQDLGGARIPPLKLTAHVEHQTRDWWRNRLQALFVGDRDEITDGGDVVSGEVTNYTVLDFVSELDIGPGTLNLSVRNLLNKDYYPAYRQSANIGSAFSGFTQSKAQGRTIGASYGIRW